MSPDFKLLIADLPSKTEQDEQLESNLSDCIESGWPESNWLPELIRDMNECLRVEPASVFYKEEVL